MPPPHTPPQLPFLQQEFLHRYEAIVSFLRRRLGNAEDAREVAHDAWLRLAEAGSARLDAPEVDDARAYVYSIAANLGLDRQRRSQWLQQHLRQAGTLATGAAQVPDVADSLMYRQALDALDLALTALPARSREVFIAHCVHDEKQANIAQRLGVSLNTVERDLISAGERIDAALRHWRGDAGNRQAKAGTNGSRRRRLASLLGLAAIGLFGATASWRHWQAQAQRWTSTFATARAGRLVQPLPDGSTLTLDALSQVEVVFDGLSRAVQLRQGAAFFAVSADADRPFVVAAGDVRVTVLGTRFGVEIEPAGAVLVQVEAGQVSVTRDGQPLAEDLTARQALRISADGTAQSIDEPAAPWRHGRLQLQAVPLASALARLARYVAYDLQSDSRAASLKVSGTVDLAEVDDWLQALPAVLPLRLVRQPDGAVRFLGRMPS